MFYRQAHKKHLKVYVLLNQVITNKQDIPRYPDHLRLIQLT